MSSPASPVRPATALPSDASDVSGDERVPASQRLTLFAYMARYTGVDIQKDLAQIEQRARRHNPTQKLTGVLVYDAGVFVQVLEGPADAVTALVARILCDPRADNLVVLFHDLVVRRSVGEWSMLPLRLDTATGVGPFTLETFRSAYRGLSKSRDLDAFVRALRALLPS